MNFTDVAAIISAWLLGIFTNEMTNDSSAIIQCRLDLLDLYGMLDNLQRRDHGQSMSDVVTKIKEIKKILRYLKIHYAGLFIGWPELDSLIDSSLALIRCGDDAPHEPQNKPNHIGVNLCQKWNSSHKNIWRFVNANLLIRIWLRIQSLCK